MYFKIYFNRSHEKNLLGTDRLLFLQFLRVTTQQTALITANFMSEQLEGDMKRQELVRDHKMSQKEADEQSKKWEKVGRP